MMPVIGYTPAPNGVGYNFQKDDGSTAYLYGSQADDLARFLDQTKPPDARLAANTPTPSFDNPKALRPPTDLPYDPANPMGGLPDFAPPPSPAPAGDAAPLAPQPVPGGYAAEPPPQEEVTRHFKFVGGTPSVDPEMLRRTGVPVEASETVSGAIPETPEERAARVKRQEGVMADFAASAEEQKAVAAERTALAKESQTNALNAAIKADIDQRDAHAQLMAAKNAADSKWAEIQNENQAAAAQRVDPNRLFHGKNGAAVAIGSALMAGLGAYGSTLARGPNYAQQIIQSAIDRDIASQTDAIQRQGVAARNAVSDFARTYGLTLEEAKMGVKSAQLRYAASMAELNGSKIGTLDAKQRAAALNMELTKQSEALAMDMRNMYEGRVQKHFQVIRPQRGSRGGMVETSREEKISTGQNPEARKARSEERQAQNVEDKNVQDYGKQKNAIEEAKVALKQYTEVIGGAPQADGSVVWRNMDIPDTGLLGGTTPAISEEARNVEQKREWLKARVGKVLSGASVSPTQEKQIMSLITSTNEETARRGVELLQDELSRMNDTNDAAFGPKVITQFEENKGFVSGRNQKRTEGGPRPAGVIK